uniref:Secreted protein n=1 Tax=Mola mola TaxID=94237 RepID=A0A3Q3XMW7_MOLML
MPRRVRVVLFVHMAALLLLGWPNRAGRVRKKADRTRSCLDQPEEILEQMFGRLSVGVMSAFHHALQLEPRIISAGFRVRKENKQLLPNVIFHF